MMAIKTSSGLRFRLKMSFLADLLLYPAQNEFNGDFMNFLCEQGPNSGKHILNSKHRMPLSEKWSCVAVPPEKCELHSCGTSVNDSARCHSRTDQNRTERDRRRRQGQDFKDIDYDCKRWTTSVADTPRRSVRCQWPTRTTSIDLLLSYFAVSIKCSTWR